MNEIIDNFDKNLHEQALNEFQKHLAICGYKLENQISKVIIDPFCIAGINDLVHIRHKKETNVHIGSLLTVVIAIDKTVLQIYDVDNNFIRIIAGNPTRKGYRSKIRDFEVFTVKQNLDLTTESLYKMKTFIHKFKLWNDGSIQESRYLDGEYSTSYEKYGGAYGFDDNTIDDAFDGDPENSWNID